MTLVRLLVCLVGLFSGGMVLLAYVIAWIVMPLEPYLLPQQVAPVAPAGVATS